MNKRRMGYYVGDLRGVVNAHYTVEEWDKLNYHLGMFVTGLNEADNYHAEGRNDYLGCCKFIVYRDDHKPLVKDECRALYWYFLGVRHALKITPMDEEEAKRLHEEGTRIAKVPPAAVSHTSATPFT